MLQPLDTGAKLCYSCSMKNQQSTMTVTYQTDALDISYNGWSNYETWNVALWLQNDEGLYNLACESGSYQDFIEEVTSYGDATPDGVKWTDPKVNAIQLNSDVFDF